MNNLRTLFDKALNRAGQWLILGWAGVTQLVECDLAKVDVAGSNPVSRSKRVATPANIYNGC